jgi:outer membrane protein OmpA-like peptidoglycan-associated protein
MRKQLVARSIALVLAAAVGTACSTSNPFTQEGQVSNTAKGAGIGALVGGAFGALTGRDSGSRVKRGLIGAGAGALAGGAVGHYMDRQEEKLRVQLANTGVSVTRDGDNIILNMPGNITFSSGSSDINADFYEVLKSVGLVLDEFDKTIINIAGHTDSTGTLALNQRLSLARADSVGQYLATQGVDQGRIETQGAGPNQPIAPNSTVSGRAANRRVELTLVPRTK